MGAASRAAARKQKDKWKAKRWYTIRAPRQPWHFKVIGETLGEEDELIIFDEVPDVQIISEERSERQKFSLKSLHFFTEK